MGPDGVGIENRGGNCCLEAAHTSVSLGVEVIVAVVQGSQNNRVLPFTCGNISASTDTSGCANLEPF